MSFWNGLFLFLAPFTLRMVMPLERGVGMPDALTVFISYSHDSRIHKQWVAELATKLIHNGINVILDQWDLAPGDDLPVFMEKNISSSNRVLVICTDEYVRKADAREGGVGYEETIVTAELIKNLNTNKFIPIIRQASGKNKKPKCLETRLHIEAENGVISDEDWDLLLRELHQVPLPKPPLGQNPFALTPSGEEIRKEVQIERVVPQIPEELSNPSEVYSLALETARRGDTVGWRQMLKKIRPTINRGLLNWREKYERNQPSDTQALHTAVDEAVETIAPLLVVTLVGVESGRAEFRDQRGVFDDIFNISGWNLAGLTSLIKLPSALGFVYQGLHGAVCMNTGQMELALSLIDMKVKNPMTGEYKPMWQRRDIMGWPTPLSGHCSVAWDYLSKAVERWEWLLKFFVNSNEYHSALSSYYMALNIYELGQDIMSGYQNHIIQTDSLSFNIPLCFAGDNRDVTDKAFSILTNKKEVVQCLWTRSGVKREKMVELWLPWLKQCNRWISNLDRQSKRFFSMEEMPHSKFFEVV